MPKIRISHETLRSTAKSIDQCQADQKQVIADVAKVIEALKTGWEGEARKGFEAVFDAVKPTYEKFAAELEEFSKFLTMYSEQMENIDVAGRERFNGTTNA